MHTKRIIPCLDVNNGRVVKGVNFVSLTKQVQMSLYFLILQHHRMPEVQW